jgi:hypothetical protein
MSHNEIRGGCEFRSKNPVAGIRQRRWRKGCLKEGVPAIVSALALFSTGTFLESLLQLGIRPQRITDPMRLSSILRTASISMAGAMLYRGSSSGTDEARFTLWG